MRRLILALVGLTVLGAAGGTGRLGAETAKTDCTDYCGEKASERCERIDSWRCTWYILGCLAGCNIASA